MYLGLVKLWTAGFGSGRDERLSGAVGFKCGIFSQGGVARERTLRRAQAMLAVVAYSIGEIGSARTLFFLRQKAFRVEIVPPVNAKTHVAWLQNELLGARPRVGVGNAGCTLAHWEVWDRISRSQSTEEDLFLVLEDDVEITRFGERNLLELISTASAERYDLLHFGNRAELFEKEFWEARRRS